MAFGDLDEVVHFLFKHLVVEILLPRSQLGLRTLTHQHLLTPSNQRMQSQDIRIRRLLVKIRILNPITRIRQTQPRRIRPELLNTLPHGERVPFTL